MPVSCPQALYCKKFMYYLGKKTKSIFKPKETSCTDFQSSESEHSISQEKFSHAHNFPFLLIKWKSESEISILRKRKNDHLRMSSTSEYTDDEEAPPPTSFEIEPQFRLIDFSQLLSVKFFHG